MHSSGLTTDLPKMFNDLAGYDHEDVCYDSTSKPFSTRLKQWQTGTSFTQSFFGAQTPAPDFTAAAASFTASGIFLLRV